jgi:hypothetical protein
MSDIVDLLDIQRPQGSGAVYADRLRAFHRRRAAA